MRPVGFYLVWRIGKLVEDRGKFWLGDSENRSGCLEAFGLIYLRVDSVTLGDFGAFGLGAIAVADWSERSRCQVLVFTTVNT